jgi:heme exporter protein D
MGTHPWWIWIALIVLSGLLVLRGTIVQSIAMRRSGLDEKERAVVRRAARVSRGEQIGRNLVDGVLGALNLL